MGSLFEAETKLWDNEVDILAADMVKKGTPPYEALIRAKNTVSQNRKRETRNDRKGQPASV